MCPETTVADRRYIDILPTILQRARGVGHVKTERHARCSDCVEAVQTL